MSNMSQTISIPDLPRRSPPVLPPPMGRVDSRSSAVGGAIRQAKASGESRTASAAMDRYADGDASAFGDLYTALAPRLLPYLRRCAGDSAAASDLLQQTMLQLHLTRGRFLRGANVVPWAFAIARRVAIDEARRTQRRIGPVLHAFHESKDELVTAATAEEELHAAQLAHRAGAELARLPEPQRTVFHLIRIEGLSVREVAQKLGTSANAVKLRAHRAYLSLRSALEDNNEGEQMVTQPRLKVDGGAKRSWRRTCPVEDLRRGNPGPGWGG
jgi:RNA polymerase sigma-70 factor (ECF subfamily)